MYITKCVCVVYMCVSMCVCVCVCLCGVCIFYLLLSKTVWAVVGRLNPSLYNFQKAKTLSCLSLKIQCLKSINPLDRTNWKIF